MRHGKFKLSEIIFARVEELLEIIFCDFSGLKLMIIEYDFVNTHNGHCDRLSA